MVAFKGNYPIRSKIVLQDNRYDGRNEEDHEVLKKIRKFHAVCGFINRADRSSGRIGSSGYMM